MSWKDILKQKKLSPKQKKIAEAAEPKTEITGADFKAIKDKKERQGSRNAFTARD
tara:strand:+ start:1346 stop:1510 length:165 start_codon:yes stop_codon:yes gene_type:complete